MSTVPLEKSSVVDSATSELVDGAPVKPLPLPVGVNKRTVLWGYAVSFIVLHLAALLIFVPYFFSWVGVLAWYLGVTFIGQLGVPVCYHRQLTHRSFKSPKWFERTLATLALCSGQETPARWVAWHRMHHQHSDHRDDPHSPLVNFGWGHVNWLVYENKATADFSLYQKYARDILEDPYYMWLEKIRFPMLWFVVGHAIVYWLVAFGICCLCYGGPTAEAWRITWSVFVWGVLFRLVYVWHITWSVNSLSHLFGYRNYKTSDDSRNNWFVALITGGEGWHNNHHADPASASVQHRWWEWDMNYWIIKLFEMVGLASHVVPPRHRRGSLGGKSS